MMGKVDQSKTERMKELIDVLNKAAYAYYAKDMEIMSNYEYDSLYDELVLLEEETGVVLSDLKRWTNCPRNAMKSRCFLWQRPKAEKNCAIG